MKTIVLNLGLCTLLLVGCKANISGSDATTPTGDGNAEAFEMNYTDDQFITETTSSDPRAQTCRDAGGVYLIDPDTTDTYCLRGASATDWKARLLELNQYCTAAQSVNPQDRRLRIYDSTPMESQLLEVTEAYIECELNYGCYNGKMIRFYKAGDVLVIEDMPGCA